MKEIGSEFWPRYEVVDVAASSNEVHLLSGRTALHFIICDILLCREAKRALLPSYCCDSMILPFIQADIEVNFYPVDRFGIEYPYENDADIVLLLDFFGYACKQNSEIACHEHRRGKTIIYDSTHKLDGNADVECYVDYSFCSYRKWFYCNDAIAVKHQGTFVNGGALAHHKQYIDSRDNAAFEKARYIAGQIRNKESFLSKFNCAEEILDEDYIGYSGVPVRFDISEIISCRRKNAAYLIGELKRFPMISLWQDELQDRDAPMFVPILIDPSTRNELRKHLISQQIYCPIHWPKSPYHKECNELYDMELSLVCDQRYNLEDMAHLVSATEAFFMKK